MIQETCRFLFGQAVHARPVSWPGRVGRWCRRNPVVASLAAALLALLLGGTGGALFLARQATRKAAEATEAKKEAQESERQLRERNEQYEARWYVTDMMLAQQAFEEGDLRWLDELLGSWRQPRRAGDLRGWEWHHLWRVSHAWQRTLDSRKAPQAPPGRSRPGRIFDHLEGVGAVPADWWRPPSSPRLHYSPDGKLLAVYEKGGSSVSLWDVATSADAGFLSPPSEPPRLPPGCHCVGFSPDVATCAVAAGKRIFWFELSSRKLLRSVSCPIRPFTFSPDGKYLAGTKAKDGPVMLADTTTGRIIRTLHEPLAGMLLAAYSPDGRLLAGASRQGVSVWDVESEKRLQHFPIQQDKVDPCLAFTPDSRHLAVGAGSTVTLWEAWSGQEANGFRSLGTIHALTVSPDGKSLAVVTPDRVLLFDLDARELRLALPERCQAVAFEPKGLLLATTSAHAVKLWDTALDPACLRFHGRSSVSFSPDGQRFATCTDSKSHLPPANPYGPAGPPAPVYPMPPRQALLCDAHTGKPGAGPVLDELTSNIIFSPDRRCLAGAVEDVVVLWDAATGDQVKSFKSVDEISQKETRTANQIERRRMLFELAVHRVNRRITRVALSPDGRLIAGLNSSKVQVWDVRTGTARCALDKLPITTRYLDVSMLASHMSFSVDGKRLATGGPNSRLALWDTATGKEVLPRLGTEDAVSCLAFSPDGQWLAVALDGRKLIELWDVASARLLFTLRGHKGDVRALAFHPAGTRLASAGDDQTVRLWDIALGQEVLALQSESAVADLAFSPDGKRLAGVSNWPFAQGWVWETAPIGVGGTAR